MNKIRLRPPAAALTVALAVAVALPVAACGGAGSAPPAVPSLSQSPAADQAGSTPGAGPAGGSRAAALHAAAECIRRSGIPGYADPVLTPSGQVYTDSRSFQDVSQSVANAVQHACATLIATAGLNPAGEPPAPPQLVQAGVRSAECLRAHGMPNVTDPTARSPYTPGHGFGMNATEMPAGGKQSPAWQHARQACAALVDAEIRASTLASLGDDG